MLKKIVILVLATFAALVAIVLVAAAFQPDSYSMERSAVLDAMGSQCQADS
ncbi:hypothetical protein ACFQY0_10705 [Haloferula chungangensis]|uniref:Uncharacterized protein n=1 Tax=Haloferula chungangensis TaxID=1048331 RepID=A0ABW2L5K6_9BACT